MLFRSFIEPPSSPIYHPNDSEKAFLEPLSPIYHPTESEKKFIEPPSSLKRSLDSTPIHPKKKRARRGSNMRWINYDESTIAELIVDIQTEKIKFESADHDYTDDELACMVEIVKYHDDADKRLICFSALQKIAKYNERIALTCRALEKDPSFYVLLSN